jgi:hypothetical protein
MLIVGFLLHVGKCSENYKSSCRCSLVTIFSHSIYFRNKTKTNYNKEMSIRKIYLRRMYKISGCHTYHETKTRSIIPLILQILDKKNKFLSLLSDTILRISTVLTFSAFPFYELFKAHLILCNLYQ